MKLRSRLTYTALPATRCALLMCHCCPQACLEYVRNLPNVVFNTRFIGAAGVSNGGFMATPIASRYSIYTHSMNMHDT